MRIVVLLVAMLVTGVGCQASDHGDDVSDPGSDGHELVSAPLDGMQSQGPNLLGARLDQMGHEPGYHANMLNRGIAADGQTVTVEFDGSAALRAGTHRGADPYFTGMLLSGSAGAHLRITGSRGGYDLALYKVELQTSGGWVNLCDNDGDEAVVLAGKWQKTGYHEPAADRFSFACTGAVGFKCTLWGYLAGGDSTKLSWRAHQACTRMARGDYCANGHPHTRPGTLINIYDYAGVSARPPRHFDGVHDWPPDANRMFFEAAWNDSAHPASCLSRRRWQSLPGGALCDNDDLPDPRQDTSVGFCEDIDWPDPGSDPTGALLFNESRYTDLSLHVWSKDDDLVSTVRGYYELPDVIQPFPSVGGYRHVRNDGIVLRSLRSTDDRSLFEELHLYTRASDAVVAGVSAPPDGFDDRGFEGFAVKVQSGPLVPFNLYINRVNGDYLSTTGTPSSDYELHGLIGYVMPPETR